MEFVCSELQAMLLDSAERLLAEQGGVEGWRAQRESALGYDEARWAQFAELGWLALPLPEQAGGLGGTIEDVALLNIELGRALAGEPYVSSAVIGGFLLSADPHAHGALLDQLAAGSVRIALGASSTVQARRDGEDFVLDGAVQLVVDAASATHFVIPAGTVGDDGTALFMVPAALPAAEHYPLIDGTRAADLRFDALRVDASALLAGADHGAALLGEALARGQIALMAQAVGSIEACLALCGAYAAERKQFGAAIGSFQAIQHLLADMFVAAHQARSMLYYAIAGANEPAAERSAALAAARIVVGEAGQLVSRTGIQIHGGYGLTDEYAVSHHFRRLMCLEKLYGDIDSNVARLGEHLFA